MSFKAKDFSSVCRSEWTASVALEARDRRGPQTLGDQRCSNLQCLRGGDRRRLLRISSVQRRPKKERMNETLDEEQQNLLGAGVSRAAPPYPYGLCRSSCPATCEPSSLERTVDSLLDEIPEEGQECGRQGRGRSKEWHRQPGRSGRLWQALELAGCDAMQSGPAIGCVGHWPQLGASKDAMTRLDSMCLARSLGW